MDHPPAYSDTDPRALAVWTELLGRMTPGAKIAAVFELTSMAFRAAEAGVRLEYPEAGDREVFLRAASRRLGRDLMIRVYGWDPAAHESSRRV